MNNGIETQSLHRIICNHQSLSGTLESLYRASFYSASDRPHFKRNGGKNAWALDLRESLSKSEFLSPICYELIGVLQKYQVHQIAGKGYGAFLLIGGIIALGDGFRAGLLREAPKEYGFKQLVEGGLRKDESLFVVDDILSSGRTVINVLDNLLREGYSPAGVITVFHYGWRRALESLAKYDLIMETLGTLEKR